MAVVTQHKPYFDIDLKWTYEIMRTPVIVDGRNVIDQSAAEKTGFVYKGVGKGFRQSNHSPSRLAIKK